MKNGEKIFGLVWRLAVMAALGLLCFIGLVCEPAIGVTDPALWLLWLIIPKAAGIGCGALLLHLASRWQAKGWRVIE